MWDIVKVFVLYKVVNNPLTVFVCTVLIVALLLLAGAFIKFKNGIFSWVCYLVVLTIPLTYVTLTSISLVYPPEDLKLSKPYVLTYKEIQADKIIVKKGFRREAEYKLLGIDTIKTQQRLDDVRELINSYSNNNTLTYKTSDVYEGVILYDDSGTDLNLMLIQKGYVREALVSPLQYKKASEVAQINRVGIWASVVSSAPSSYTWFTKVMYFVSFSIVLFLTELQFINWFKLWQKS